MNDTNSEFHPFADLFPMMSDDAFEELVADMIHWGMREPITLFEGKVLDGRNRYRALQRIDPTTELNDFASHYDKFYGNRDEALAYVVSKNLKRRHLDTSQRAAVAAKLANLRDGQRQVGKFADVPTLSEAAKLLNVSERTVRHARKVLDHGDPDLIQEVQRGEVTVSAAVKSIAAKKVGPAFSDAQLSPKYKGKPDLGAFVDKLTAKIANLFGGELGAQISGVIQFHEDLSEARCGALEAALTEIECRACSWWEELTGVETGRITFADKDLLKAWDADRVKWVAERRKLKRQIEDQKLKTQSTKATLGDVRRQLVDLRGELAALRDERDSLRYEHDHPVAHINQ
jgi:hypothetical protein